MDLLLVNSPLFAAAHTSNEDSLPPLGLGYLATAVQAANLEVGLLDAVAMDCGASGVIEAIQSLRPRFVGINVFSTNLELVQMIVMAAFDAHVVVGGPAIMAMTDTVSGWRTDNPVTVIEGEAEHALPVFLRGELKAEPWQGRTDRGVIRISPSHPLFPNLIDLPLDRSFFHNEPLFDATWGVKEAHIVTSRGCGHDCAFCAAARSVNTTPIRFRSEADIRNEILCIRQRMPEVNGIRVIDDLFIRNRRSIERACRLFGSMDLSWRAMAHVNSFRGIERAVFAAMRRSGCIELSLGVESGNPQRRQIIGKPADIRPTVDLVEHLLESGIAVKAYFIYGFPGESLAEMADTHALAKSMAEIAARTGIRFRPSVFKFRPYHGTRMYNELLASGVKLGKIAADSGLYALIGRRQFNFMSENYSEVELETLDGFIRATQELGHGR